jgi:hypothetical protein
MISGNKNLPDAKSALSSGTLVGGGFHGPEVV